MKIVTINGSVLKMVLWNLLIHSIMYNNFYQTGNYVNVFKKINNCNHNNIIYLYYKVLKNGCNDYFLEGGM